MERTQKELYWYWMASCPGVGIGSIFAVAAAGHTLEQIFADPEALLDRRLRLPEKVRAYLRARANFDLLQEEIHAIERRGIRVMTAVSPEYPQLLKDLWRPPAVLYALGNGGNFSKRSLARWVRGMFLGRVQPRRAKWQAAWRKRV